MDKYVSTYMRLLNTQHVAMEWSKKLFIFFENTIGVKNVIVVFHPCLFIDWL